MQFFVDDFRLSFAFNAQKIAQKMCCTLLWLLLLLWLTLTPTGQISKVTNLRPNSSCQILHANKVVYVVRLLSLPSVRRRVGHAWAVGWLLEHCPLPLLFPPLCPLAVTCRCRQLVSLSKLLIIN